MKFYSSWQPLEDEDAHTALVFGFMRHAPTAHALNPWLSEVLERDVEAEQLEPDAFWPRYPSTTDSHGWTEPDMAFPASDGQPLWVIVEAKPWYGQHGPAQLAREVVDTARANEADRIALVMIGADVGDPPEIKHWHQEIEKSLRQNALGHVQAELRYSSWARVGGHIQRCAELAPDWGPYAHDVREHLLQKALLGYNGAPMFDDLEGFTVRNVVEGFNRIVIAARQFFLALHGQPRFQALSLTPLTGKSYRMLRDSPSRVLTEGQEYFTTTSLISPYRRPSWREGEGVFVAVFLDNDEPELNAGAYYANNMTDLPVSYGESEAVEAGELEDEELRRARKAVLTECAAAPWAEFRFSMRPWQQGQASEDVEWALTSLEAAVGIWSPGRLLRGPGGV